MNILARFITIDEYDKAKAVRNIVKESTPDFDYYFMLFLSTLVATFGLIIASEATVIGAMLLAPLLAPLLGLALGLSMSEHSLISRSFVTLVRSGVLAVLSSFVATLIFAPSLSVDNLNAVILSRTEPSIVYFMVAFFSGFAVAYASARPKLSESLPGVAISVALIPPLAVVGIGFAVFSLKIISDALLMFFLNVAGIVFAAMLSYSLMDVHHKRFLAEKLVQKEQERLKQEKEELLQNAEIKGES